MNEFESVSDGSEQCKFWYYVFASIAGMEAARIFQSFPPQSLMWSVA